MRWPWQSEPQTPKKPIPWADSLNATNWQHYTSPETIVPTILLTGTILAGVRVYRLYLRRIPATSHVAPGFYRKRSLFGTVTRVGDGDNFHLYHTPGGRLTGWGWIRRVPEKAGELKRRTISIRIAGIDAPEGAHFGKTAQPGAVEALEWLQSYILGRRVRARIYKKDQYDRVVATVFVRRGLIRRDVGLEMLKAGWATVYEAKSGSEFGNREDRYRAAEEKAKSKKKGMWGQNMKNYESPRDYKTRVAALDPEKGGVKGDEKKEGGILASLLGGRK